MPERPALKNGPQSGTQDKKRTRPFGMRPFFVGQRDKGRPGRPLFWKRRRGVWRASAPLSHPACNLAQHKECDLPQRGGMKEDPAYYVGRIRELINGSLLRELEKYK